MGVTNKIESSFANLDGAEQGPIETVAEDFTPLVDESYDDTPWDEGESDVASNSVLPTLLTALLAIAGIAWVAAFVLSRVAIVGFSIDRAALAFWVAEANALALPLALIAILLLFVRRGSAAEARRFARTAADLEQVEARLADTLTSATQTLAANRDELQEVSAQLGGLGEQASHQLSSSAAQVAAAFDSSTKAAEQMQSVTSAAVSNLDRLRSQVPVLTNSAKDLTNAIAEAGGGAAEHVRDLSLMLTQIGEQNGAIADSTQSMRSNTEAHFAAMAEQWAALNSDFSHQLQNRRGEAEALFGSIGSNMDDAGARLIGHLAEADVRVSALMQEAQSAVRNLAQLVASNSQIATQHSQQTLSEVDDTIAQLGGKIDTLLSQSHARAKDQVEALADDMARLDAVLSTNLQAVAAEQSAHIDAMATAIEETNAALTQCGTDLTALTEQQQQALHEGLASLNVGVAEIAQSRANEAHEMQAVLTSLNAHIDDANGRIAALSELGTEQSARLAFAFEASSQTYTQLSDLMAASEEKIDALLTMNDRLRDNIALTSDAISETLPGNLNRFGERLGDVKEAIAEQSSLTRDLENQGERLVVQFRKLDKLIAEQSTAINQLNDTGTQGIQARLADGQMLAGLLSDIRRDLAELDGEKAEELTALTDALKAKVEIDLGELRAHLTALDYAPLLQSSLDSIDVDAMAAQQVEALSTALRGSLHRIEAEQSATLDRLEVRLQRLTEMAEIVEANAAQTEGQFGSLDEEGFARRMALLTESLNSAAIDVAKILSNEVTDTAWQNYLKGDRGVFTRRAVRLLNSQEVRVVARQYDEDGEFRAQVNRYIHDFESMMRVLLSTRDGHVVSVTLLSSDVGKLYVALAQAIERLRQ